MSEKRRPPPDPVAVLRGRDLPSWTWPSIIPDFFSSQGPRMAHGGAAGVYCVATSPSIENKLMSQGRDGTCKYWDVLEDGSLSRKPLLTLRTDAYHFCKLSLVKTPIQFKDPDYAYDSSGSTLMASAGEDSAQVEIWDLNTAERVACLQNVCKENLGGPSYKSRGMRMALQAFLPSQSQGFLNILAGCLRVLLLIPYMLITSLNSGNGVPLRAVNFHTETVLSLCLDSYCHGGIMGAADNKIFLFTLNPQSAPVVGTAQGD